MTFTPATAEDLGALLGDVDPIAIDRILALGASCEEIGEALTLFEEDEGFGEEPHEPSSPRVIEVRHLLDDLVGLDAHDESGLESPMMS